VYVFAVLGFPDVFPPSVYRARMEEKALEKGLCLKNGRLCMENSFSYGNRDKKG